MRRRRSRRRTSVSEACRTKVVCPRVFSPLRLETCVQVSLEASVAEFSGRSVEVSPVYSSHITGIFLDPNSVNFANER